MKTLYTELQEEQEGDLGKIVRQAEAEAEKNKHWSEEDAKYFAPFIPFPDEQEAA